MKGKVLTQLLSVYEEFEETEKGAGGVVVLLLVHGISMIDAAALVAMQRSRTIASLVIIDPAVC